MTVSISAKCSRNGARQKTKYSVKAEIRIFKEKKTKIFSDLILPVIQRDLLTLNRFPEFRYEMSLAEKHATIPLYLISFKI